MITNNIFGSGRAKNSNPKAEIIVINRNAKANNPIFVFYFIKKYKISNAMLSSKIPVKIIKKSAFKCMDFSNCLNPATLFGFANSFGMAKKTIAKMEKTLMV